MKPPNIFVYSYFYPATSLNSFKELSLDKIALTVDQSLPANSFTVASLSEERLRRTTPQTFFDYTQLLILYGNPSASSSPPLDTALDSKLADYVARGGRVLCIGPPPSSLNFLLPALLSFIPMAQSILSVDLPESLHDKLNCRSMSFSISGNSLFQSQSANNSDQSNPSSLSQFMYFSLKENVSSDSFRAATILSIPTRSLAISLVCNLSQVFHRYFDFLPSFE